MDLWAFMLFSIMVIKCLALLCEMLIPLINRKLILTLKTLLIYIFDQRLQSSYHTSNYLKFRLVVLSFLPIALIESIKSIRIPLIGSCHWSVIVFQVNLFVDICGPFALIYGFLFRSGNTYCGHFEWKWWGNCCFCWIIETHKIIIGFYDMQKI